MIHIDNLINSIYLLSFNNNTNKIIFNLRDIDLYSFSEISNAINLKFKRNIIYINFPVNLINFLLKIEKYFSINFFKKIFRNEIYVRSNMEKYNIYQINF